MFLLYFFKSYRIQILIVKQVNKMNNRYRKIIQLEKLYGLDLLHISAAENI